MLTVLAINLLGDWLRDDLDPILGMPEPIQSGPRILGSRSAEAPS
jgi:hypothetical protein